MEGCQCIGSPDRPACSTINLEGLAFNTHEDLSGLIFTRSSASKLLDFDMPRVTPGRLNTFPLFSNLPMELRVKIWNFALSVPRLIVVSYTSTTGEDDRRIFVDAPPPPSCLLACRESRAEALKMYPKHLITTLCRSPTSLNFANDHFLLGGPNASLDIDYLMSILLPENSHRIRFLHVSKGCYKEFAYWTHLRERFSGLEELTISFPFGAALLPYTHECWYGALSRDNKDAVVRDELYEREDEVPGCSPEFRLKIVHYGSPPLKDKY